MSEKSLEEHLNAAVDPAFVIDDSGKILWSNVSADRVFKLSSGGRSNLSQVFAASDVRSIIGTEHYSSLAVRLDHPTLGTLEQTAVVMDISAGNPDQVLFLISLKSIASQSSQVEQRQEFLGTVAHDLKNPLAAIFGYADALLDTSAGEGLNDRQREVISRIRGTASRSIDLVRNYQHLSALQAGTIALPAYTVDLGAVTKSVVEYTWRESAPAVELHFTDEELAVRIERIQLERIVSNLLSNAMKYTPPEGKITLCTWQDSGRAFMSINNSAPAIDEAELPFIFDRYSRVSSSSGTSGSGLGLYIVKQIVETVLGSIEAKSSPEQGTTFTVSFPLG